MTELHIIQTGFFKPVLENLTESGVDMHHLLTKCRLNKFRLDDPESYIPVNTMYALFDAIKKQQGKLDFLSDFGDKMQLSNLGKWGEMIINTPNLLRACKYTVQYKHVISSHERMGLDITEAQTKLWSRFIDGPVANHDEVDHLNMALLLNTIRLATGADWAPLELHLQSQVEPDLDIILPPGYNTKVMPGQAATAVVFPTTLLSLPIPGVKTDVASIPDFPTETDKLAGKLEKILASTETTFIPGLEIISDISGIPLRSLQRKFSEEGTTFHKTLDQWRFKSAIQLLADPDILIKDISTQLRYANVPNFERAFRRWTNTTPIQYRKKIMAN